MNMNELCTSSATELAGMIAKREVSSREVVDAHLARIDETNPALNAVTLVLAEEARRSADEADRSEPIGPLHGVPVSVKENIDLAGTPTTSGLTILAEAMPASDAPIVTRLRDAGAIPIARTNLPEFGLRIDTSNPLRGTTRNAWSPDLTPGGSSGGEGAAIAAGMSPLGLGNDIGGSLRNPAFCNGIVGFRPTMHRVPDATTIEPADGPLSGQLMATNGPMARHVADVELAMSLLNGADVRDPLSVDVALGRPPVARRAGVVTTALDGPIHASAAQGVERAVAALESQGWDIVPIEFPEFELVFEVWNRLMGDDLVGLLATMGEVIESELAAALQGHVDYRYEHPLAPGEVHMNRHRLMRAWSAMFADTPVVVSPVWPEPQFPCRADLERGTEFVVHMLQFVTPAPLLGLPALALPTGVVDGLPVGVQIHADRWNDAWCFEAGAAIEAELGTLPIPTLN